MSIPICAIWRVVKVKSGCYRIQINETGIWKFIGMFYISKDEADLSIENYMKDQKEDYEDALVVETFEPVGIKNWDRVCNCHCHDEELAK